MILKINKDKTGYVKFIDAESNNIEKIITFSWEYIEDNPENMTTDFHLVATNIGVGFYPPYYRLITDMGRIDYIQPSITEKNGNYLIS